MKRVARWKSIIALARQGNPVEMANHCQTVRPGLVESSLQTVWEQRCGDCDQQGVVASASQRLLAETRGEPGCRRQHEQDFLIGAPRQSASEFFGDRLSIARDGSSDRNVKVRRAYRDGQGFPGESRPHGKSQHPRARNGRQSAKRLYRPLLSDCAISR